MKPFDRSVLLPSLLVALVMLLASYVARLDHTAGWRDPAATALMAVAVVGADALRTVLDTGSVAVSLSSVLLGSGAVLATLICRDASFTTELIPTLAGTAWILFLARPHTRGVCCRPRQAA